MKGSGFRARAALLASVIALPAAMLMSASAAPTFELTRLGGSGGFEQGINILPDQTIYVDEPSGLGAHSKLFRSRDFGVSFQRLTFPTPYGRLPGGGDSDVVLTDDGRVYFLDLWGGSNSLTVSHDGGDTWVTGNPIVGIPTSDRQWIGLGARNGGPEGPDTVYVVYSKLFVQPDWSWLARSDDGGLTFTYHRPIPFPTGGTEGPTGNLVSKDDFLAFVFEDGARLGVGVSEDAGETWTSTPINPLIPDADDNIPSIAMDGDNLHVTYVNRLDSSIMVASSHDRGATWSAPQAVATTDGINVFTWVAARDGKVGVAWYGSQSDVNRPDDVPADGTWDVHYVESLDNGGTFGTPVVVAPAVKTGHICTVGLDCSSGREVGDFIALEIGYDGKAYIAFYNRGPGYIARQIS